MNEADQLIHEKTLILTQVKERNKLVGMLRQVINDINTIDMDTFRNFDALIKSGNEADIKLVMDLDNKIKKIYAKYRK